MSGYLRLEVARALRDPKYIILAVVAPIGFYLLFTNLFGQDTSNGLSGNLALMVSMGVYGAMWAVLSATGPRIAQERSIGWLLQLRLLPVRASSVLLARLLAAVILAGPAIALVFLTAVLVHGISLTAGQWVALLVALWLAVLPVALLGIVIGYAAGADAAFGVIYGLYTVLAALGGLWMPISMLPSGLQTMGKLLPSYNAADLGWRIESGHAVTSSSVLILATWALLLSLLALVYARRRARAA